MGTEVHYKSYVLGYHSMRDNNENPNSSSWPLFYGDKTLQSGHYYNGFMPRTITDAYQGYDRDALKKKMLEHEAIFKNQVYELHRLYRIQRDMMEEIERKELQKYRLSFDTSSSSTFLASQMPSGDARKWHVPNFPLENPGCARLSFSGTEIISSPLSCTKGSSTQAGRVSSQNEYTAKDCEVLEFRPSKVRKTLDLQLSADEYIDTEEEQFQDNKISEISSYPPDKIHRIASGSAVKLLLSGGKIDCHEDAVTSDSCRRSSVRFADLNEPIKVEEATVPASVDFLAATACHGEFSGRDLLAKPKSRFLGLTKENLWDSQKKINSGNMNHVSIENRGNGRELLSYIYDAGNGKNNLNPISRRFPQDKFLVPSHPGKFMNNEAHQPPGILPTDRSREGRWREGAGVGGIEFYERSNHHSSFNYLEPVVASHPTNLSPFSNSSDIDDSRSRSVSSLGKPCGNLVQKLNSAQTLPSSNSFATVNRSSHSSTRTYEIFREQWHAIGGSRSDLHSGSELLIPNGYYYGSSSGSKGLTHLSSSSFEYLKCNKNDIAASKQSIDPEMCFKSSNCVDLKPVKDMNLNVVIPVDSSDDADPQQGCNVFDVERKCEDHIAVLPWLRAKPANKKTEAIATRTDLNSVDLNFRHAFFNQKCENDTDNSFCSKILSQTVVSASSDHAVLFKEEVGEHQASRKILGFPIFESHCNSKIDSSSAVSTFAPLCSPPDGIVGNTKKIRTIDINLACDVMDDNDEEIVTESLVVVDKMDAKVVRVGKQIDLNSCLAEDEDPLSQLVASSRIDVKFAVEIDLEAPVVLESEEDILLVEEDQKPEKAAPQSLQHGAELQQDDVMRIAAEAIVSISSSIQLNPMEDDIGDKSEASVADSLLWFVEIVSSFVDDLENDFNKESRGKNARDAKESFTGEVDDFEAMTLLLTETKEEEYMPKPLVPEFLEVGTAAVPNRPRKGPARRGRQRRDFQRDILPGLASLSRHEVTEDLQTFGGLMRATGHSWNAGLTRRNGTRNGGARGRRRQVVVDTAPLVVASPISTPLMQQLNTIEVGLEDRSLTGWGKTTRRPRRQRCPAGNPPPVPLI